MKRRRLLEAGAAALACAIVPARARATGGLDVWDAPPPALALPVPAASGMIRVLLASGNAFAVQSDDGGFMYNGRPYRGSASVVALGNGRNGLVGTVELEAYVAGVVPLEAGRGWPPAALAAQAIAARTYALARRTTKRVYDVVAGSGDQQYGGRAVEAPDTTAAVQATAGQVLAYSQTMASVFYTSCCGGHTADAADVWARESLPYLHGVADPWCTTAPDYRWRASVALSDFLAVLGTRAAAIGDLQAIAAGDLDQAGRPRKVLVTGTLGTVDMALADLRRGLGARMPSPFVRSFAIEGTPAQAGANVLIEGAGRGHGIGLCQWGARNMARDGRSVSEILSFYFPGTAIRRG